MTKISQANKIALLLKEHPNKRFTAREIADRLIAQYPVEYAEKRARSADRFATDGDFVSQIVAEIGVQKDRIIRNNQGVFCQDKPRPRVYWFDPNSAVISLNPVRTNNDDIDDDIESDVEDGRINSQPENQIYSEHDLYPLLIQYLKSELKLYSMRIDEKRSKNNKGKNGNQWLHPDIIAMQPIAKDWHSLIKTCVTHGGGESLRLWAFEVKKQITRSSVRENFFQAVSNSSWANEGYLVCTGIEGNGTIDELRMLSALHGIGVLILNTENPAESEIMIPAKPKADIDWQSVNRLVEENDDMKDFIDLVANYYQTGRLRSKDWNR